MKASLPMHCSSKVTTRGSQLMCLLRKSRGPASLHVQRADVEALAPSSDLLDLACFDRGCNADAKEGFSLLVLDRLATWAITLADELDLLSEDVCETGHGPRWLVSSVVAACCHDLEVYVVISGVISKVTIVITHIKGLTTILITTHEPPSTQQ